MERRPQKAFVLRQHLQGGKIVRAVGAHDGLTTKLVQRAGFEAVWASSFEASASHGVPDASLLTMTQFLDVAEVMDLASPLPVIADCDTGFGGPLNVAYAVQRYERRGIAAICIEDKVFPKINSFANATQDLLPAEEFALKIKSGTEAKDSPDFMVIARTEALIAGLGIAEALDRARTYAAAGADAILVHSKSLRPDEILEFGAAWDSAIPLVAVPTTYPSVSETDLYNAGYRIVIYANQGMRAAVRGVREFLGNLASRRSAEGLEESLATMSEVFELQGMPVAYHTAR